MDKSVFMNKGTIPTDAEVEQLLGENISHWNDIVDFVVMRYPKAIKEWCYAGKNYGWSFRLKDKKRVIIYLLPRDNFFKVAFVFGQKATDMIMDSTISSDINKELASAKVYAEGRGIRIDVKGKLILEDIKKLIEIKLSA
jgi:hypothetical protein